MCWVTDRPERPISSERMVEGGRATLQASPQHAVYTPAMQPGRPAKKERTPFGQRLHALREQAGLSQQQLADRIGLTQRAYAYWERHPVALRPDQLLKVAEALNVSVEDLVGTNGKKKRGAGNGLAFR